MSDLPGTPEDSPMLCGNVTVRSEDVLLTAPELVLPPVLADSDIVLPPVLDAPELVLPPALTSHQADLIKIVTDLVEEKPTSVGDALKLLKTLQGKIAEWVMSEVPEKDKVLEGLKMAESVAASVGCFPCRRR